GIRRARFAVDLRDTRAVAHCGIPALQSYHPCPFFFHDPPPPASHTLSLHDALPIFRAVTVVLFRHQHRPGLAAGLQCGDPCRDRSEEHTSELQSRENLVCRLLLEKKKTPWQHGSP